MVALKAQWVVKAGLIPGEPRQGYSRTWSYTSLDYESDGNTRGHSFKLKQQEVEGYCIGLQLGGLNWVQVEYVWM